VGAVSAAGGRPPPALRLARGLIDGLDDALLALLAGRQRLARQAARSKRRAGLEPRDPAREARVRERARRLGQRLGLRPAYAEGIVAAAIREARAGQAEALATGGGDAGIVRVLAWLPPPARLAPWFRCIPERWHRRALEAAMARVLGPALAAGELAFLEGRRLGIEVKDLRLRWVVGLRDGRLATLAGPAEASVRGTATDLLLLAARVEDADALFFRRRLVLTGDTELGLTARNLLEGLRWEAVPLGLRIALARGARLARAARAQRTAAARAGGGPPQQA
jgi:predicted lipid carrier protein YhbT/chorismate mutase